MLQVYQKLWRVEVQINHCCLVQALMGPGGPYSCHS
jgi:hypothetical protein